MRCTSARNRTLPVSEFVRRSVSDVRFFSMDDVCAVCVDPLDTDNVHSLDECGHRFHSRCIIGWMQRGHLSCPTCRADLHNQEDVIPGMALMERGRFIRRTLGRRRNAPTDLKKMISTLQRAERSERECSRVYRDFQRQHRDVLRQYKSLRNKRWNSGRRKRRYERLLGLFQAPGLSLPPLIVHRLGP